MQRRLNLGKIAKGVLAGIACLWSLGLAGQETTNEDSFGAQIFLPSIEIGYVGNSADELSGGVLVKTSIEYRVRNNNDIFFRINYDNSTADYTLDPVNAITNVIEGTASFNDLLLGAGYRFGDKKLRTFIMLQAGIKYYNFPEFTQTNSVISIAQGRNNAFSTRATIGFEYYFTEKSAFSLDLLQNQVWDKQDFWRESGSAYGFSVGFITSLF
ncbi:MAG: hypothetical protein AAFQ94_12865 [Bacteroidota bacterium]